MDITDAAAPRSDQLNADDLISGPRTVTITEVRRGTAEQPIEIVTAEFGDARPYKPAKSMIRVLIEAWGKESATFKGRRLMLYRDPNVRFGKDAVGGIRISAMSHIDQRINMQLTVTRGRRAPYVVEPLSEPELIDPDQIVADMAAADSVDTLTAIGADIRGRIPDDARDRVTAAYKARMAELKALAPEPEPESEPSHDEAVEAVQEALDAEVVE